MGGMDKRLVSACIEKGAKGYVSKPLRVGGPRAGRVARGRSPHGRHRAGPWTRVTVEAFGRYVIFAREGG